MSEPYEYYDPICIVGFGTGVTEDKQTIADTIERIKKAYLSDTSGDHKSEIEFYNKLVLSTKIEERYVCLDALNLEKKYNYQVPYCDKMKLWYNYACQLAYKSCNEAINDYILNYNGNMNDITHVICHSVTGWTNPGLTHFLIHKFNLSPNTRPIEANIAGCHGGAHLIYLATSIINMDKNSVVLVCDTEIMDAPCSYPNINFKCNDNLYKNKEEFVGITLFGSGSGSLIIKKMKHTVVDNSKNNNKNNNNNSLWEIEYKNQLSCIIPNTNDDISFDWAKHDKNLLTSNTIILSPNFPKKFHTFISNKIDLWLNNFYGAKCNNIDFLKDIEYVMHCGGKKLINIVKFYLIEKYGNNNNNNSFNQEYKSNILKYSSNVYKTHGNQSGASILFVLKDACTNTLKDNIFFMAMGTGVTVQIGTLKRINLHQRLNFKPQKNKAKKNNTLKYLMFAIAILCVGICLDQCTRV